MARLSYQAPGVYVEEVPSAQKAIAGVGTNTVGFIGIVPEDEIEYPVPNEDYDPTAAQKAAEGPEKNRAEIERLNNDIRNFEQDKQTAEASLNEANAQLEQEGLSRAAKKRAETQQQNATTQIEDAQNKIQTAQSRIQELKQSQQVDSKKLKPYRFEKFKLDAEFGATRLCTNFREYRERFGTFSADDEAIPGKAKYPGHRNLTHAVYGFFQNGGTRCYVARIKSPADLGQTLENFESIDAVAIVAAPGLNDAPTYSALVSHCETCEDRFAILDCPAEVGNGGLEIGLLNYDNPNNVLPKTNKNAAFYFPYLEVVDPAKQLQDQDPARGVPLKYRGRVHVPPSGHIAGIYARTDEERGVHKAPANATVLGALNVKYYIGRPKHELLNPQGVNVIRNINGNINVWGARTIGGDKNNEWKYVNVRRLFLYIRESIDEGTQWVVFEPNDAKLWGKIRRNLSDFLTNVWRAGALFGSSPEEAFYVKCDEETNPPEVREVGQVVTEIGIAIVRPAEFVIFRVTQAGSLDSI